MFSAHPDFQYGVRWFPNRKIDRAVPFHNFFIRRDLFYRTQESRDDVTRTSWGRCDLSISYYYISVLYLLFFFSVLLGLVLNWRFLPPKFKLGPPVNVTVAA